MENGIAGSVERLLDGGRVDAGQVIGAKKTWKCRRGMATKKSRFILKIGKDFQDSLCAKRSLNGWKRIN